MPPSSDFRARVSPRCTAIYSAPSLGTLSNRHGQSQAIHSLFPLWLYNAPEQLLPTAIWSKRWVQVTVAIHRNFGEKFALNFVQRGRRKFMGSALEFVKRARAAVSFAAVFLALAAACSPLHAQTAAATISGTVKSSSGEPLAGAFVPSSRRRFSACLSRRQPSPGTLHHSQSSPRQIHGRRHRRR